MKNQEDQNGTDSLPPLMMQGPYENQRMRMMLSIASEWTWQTDDALKFSGLSRNALNKTGILSKHIMNKPLWESDHMVPAFNAKWEKLKMKMESREIFQDFVVCYLNQAESLVCLSLSGAPMFANDGQFLGYAGLAVNLTEFHRKDHGTLRLLSADPLTGYANWKTMEEAHERGLVIAKRKGKSLGVVVLRVNGVQELMDQNSFFEASQVLQSVCEKLSKKLRKGDVVGRLSVKDFGIIVQEIAQEKDLRRIMDKVSQALLGLENPTGTEISAQLIALSAPEHGESLIGITNHAYAMFDESIEGSESDIKKVEIPLSSKRIPVTQ